MLIIHRSESPGARYSHYVQHVTSWAILQVVLLESPTNSSANIGPFSFSLSIRSIFSWLSLGLDISERMRPRLVLACVCVVYLSRTFLNSDQADSWRYTGKHAVIVCALENRLCTEASRNLDFHCSVVGLNGFTPFGSQSASACYF
jgi:hypothetical protein